ncbi:MAG: hypothetical protein A2Y12_03815 [Planctomycetes bacterium GWF2_42_9]|nr:MAG: hypothetical protein A2Y12_03815 [Planctomycetes bacterium GWF2_42_9]
MYFDWLIIVVVITILMMVAGITKKYTRSVSDFLSANRCAGRYMLSVADGMAGVGVVNILAVCEMYYKKGFCSNWWMSLMGLVIVIMAVTGWITYRFRETRAMTMAQFFEIRYSKRFRIFSGIVSWTAGILNFGVFPVVTARLIVYLMDMPTSITAAGFTLPMYAIVMFIVLLVSVYLTTSGGQISIMVTDFLQGSFANVVFFILAIFMIIKFSWTDVLDGLVQAPQGQSMINPFKNNVDGSDFSISFFIAWAFITFYCYMAWQGTQGFYSSAKNPHEAKMARVIANWRMVLLWTMVLVFSVVAFAVLNNPKYGFIAEPANKFISQISDTQVQEQLRVPIVLKYILPTGLIGLFCAVLICMGLATGQSNLHSWGSIFIQDIIMPFRKKPLSSRQHLLLLKISIIGVAVFAFCFGLVFPLKDYLMMWLTITGSIYVGGGGIAIIGGLYWKRGTTAGAWCGMITGLLLSVIGIVLQNIIWPFLLPGLKESYPNIMWLKDLPIKFPVNGMTMSVLFALAAIIIYVVVSLLSKTPYFNMDRMLHRGEYAIKSEHVNVKAEPVRGWKVLFNWGGVEFNRADNFICCFTVGWQMFWMIAFVIGSICAITIGIPDKLWSSWWLFGIIINSLVGAVAVVWLLIGGFRDLFAMFDSLKMAQIDESDDGRVVKDHNLADKEINTCEKVV